MNQCHPSIPSTSSFGALMRQANFECQVSRFDPAGFPFKYCHRKNLSFDIIIIDPPTFSRDKHKSFSVQKDHPRLINEAIGLLRPQGFIVFSSSYKSFRLAKNKLPSLFISELNTVPSDFKGELPHRCYIIKPRKAVGQK